MEAVSLNPIKIKSLQVFNFIFFIVMVIMNGLANALPLNDKTTKELSDQYPNLFVPAGITFSIWGVIYFLLLLFCFVQAKSLFQKKPDPTIGFVVDEIGFWFIINAILNSLWILAWHYEFLTLSMVIMIGILVTLIKINYHIKATQPYLRSATRFIIKASFGIYLGWICIATIANATACLVGFGWTEGYILGQSWASIMILAGSFITFLLVIDLRNSYIGFATIWALCGIIIARYNDTIFYQYIVFSAILGIVIIIASIVMASTILLFSSRKKLPEPHNPNTTIPE
ncbi:MULTISPECIES: hypothetical protein [unclassified Arcicella]|uniref:hypothetical protein n=1 Tax=unclassified Arcicella TaxID=2644986 RepID=UPI002855F8E8|nr:MULTISPECIES: hypothetical protein [unclassified Arcicella]MDR6560346.1 hypothetical protein [Arcicella sp. BE51]MDR6810048.1 hypothetical protein [Arcicella sp. BE140]MDR6821397.1 hypothetical protein [Arcicella sp. BE139]